MEWKERITRRLLCSPTKKKEKKRKEKETSTPNYRELKQQQQRRGREFRHPVITNALHQIPHLGSFVLSAPVAQSARASDFYAM